MAHSQEELINLYKELREHLGHQPSFKEFCSESGVQRYAIESAFGSGAFSKLVTASGDMPQSFRKEKANLDDVFIQYGNLVRKLDKLPFALDWNFHKCKPKTGGLYEHHGIKWSEMPYKFLEFASSNPEWQDVVDIIPQKEQTVVSKNNFENRVTFESQKFLPPIVHDFISLSKDDKQSLEFEKRTNLIFQMLGFDVDEFGQGTGRNPDGVAKASQYQYAILLDAKARKESYSMGTEDRKFIEYIKKHTPILAKTGHGIVYFLIVSSSFDSDFEKARANIKIETNVVTSLISAKSLLKILSKKIEHPLHFDLKKFQELFLYGGLVDDKKVDKFVQSMK